MSAPCVAAPGVEYVSRPEACERPPPRQRRRAGRWLLLALLGSAAGHAWAQAADPADQICFRPASGAEIAPPADLRSQSGMLEVTLQFKSAVDAQGLTRYCYVTDTGLQSPTLHVSPGDQLIIHFQNALPAAVAVPALNAMHHAHSAANIANADCAGGAMSQAVTNLHFHGLNVAPTCHQDEVLNTLVQPGGSFDYAVQIPGDEPTGLYWYHPHPHGYSNAQVQGGAAGALVVDGVENVNPAVAGLPQRVFVLRDQRLTGGGAQAPTLDVSVNYVPVLYPNYAPALVRTPTATTEFWRVLNASSNTIFQLQYLIEGVAQPLQVVAIDGVPVGQGTGTVQALTQNSVALPPGARVEFILTTPQAGQQAQLVTQPIDTGRDGGLHPSRPLANIIAQSSGARAAARLAPVRTTMPITRFANLNAVTPEGRRELYFSEALQGPGSGFFITVQGAAPAVFDMSAPPNIVLHQGTTEEWTVENRSREHHVFHIHQIRFQTLAINGQPVSDAALRDTITVPHWSGSGPYPSVTLRMDFRAANIAGLFVYHCHLLAHEDAGMMGAIQVLPAGVASVTALTASSSEVADNTTVTFNATVTAANAGALNGTVQFFDGNASVGAPVAVSNGKATLTAPLASYGMHSISAAYSGDATHNQSLSRSLTVTVEDFSLSAASLTVRKGARASAPIVVTTSAGFASQIRFSCALAGPLRAATCTVTPNTLNAAGVITLDIGTRVHALRAHGTPGLSAPASTLLAAALLLLAAPRRRPHILAFGLIAAASLLTASCGGPAHSDSGIPVGTYAATVTGSCGSFSSITHSVSVAVRVVD